MKIQTSRQFLAKLAARRCFRAQRFSLSAVSAASAATLLFASAFPARAANINWTGGTNTDFETGTNWLGGVAPANDLTTDIGTFSGVVTANQPALSVSRNINGLSFTTATGGWNLGGSPLVLTLGGSGITTTNASGTNIIGANLALGATQNWSVAAGGLLSVTGNVAVTNALSFANAGAGTTVISGALSGASGITIGTAANSGAASTLPMVTLSGSNGSFSGAVTLVAGTLNINSNNALGTVSQLTIGTGTSTRIIDNTSASAVSVSQGINLQTNLTFTGSNDLALTGSVSNGTGAKTVTVAGSTLTVGSFTGSGPITKAGAGILAVSGTIGSTGALTVAGGTLRSTRTTGVTLGTGAISITGGTISLAPTGSTGNLAQTGGTAAAGTTFTYNSGATFSLDRGTAASLTYTYGSASAGTAFARGTNGTLILSVGVIANLGGAGTTAGGGERFIINSGSTAPTTVNGLVDAVVAQDRGNGNAGDFVTYGTTNGFAATTYTKTNDLTTSANTDVVAITNNTTSAANSLAYALKVSGATVNNTGNTITLGSSGNAVAGLILNGGTISGGTLTTPTNSATEFTIYTSGTSAISSSINTTTNQAGISLFGPGTLDLSGSAGNTYTGGLRVNQSTVIVNNDNQLGSTTGVVALNGGTLQTSGTLALGTTGQRNIVLANGGASNGGTFSVTSGTTTYTSSTANSKVISGSGSLIKTGAGTFTLAGNAANTYTGGTVVNAGTLLANVTGTGLSSTGTGAVTVNNGGTVLGGTGTISGAVTMNTGAILQGGSGTVGGMLTLSSNPTLASGSLIELTLGAGGTHSTLALSTGSFAGFNANQGFILDNVQPGVYDNIIIGVASGINTSGWTITNGSGYTYSFSDDGANIDLNIAAVPEPSTLMSGLLLISFAAGVFVRRRQLTLKRA